MQIPKEWEGGAWWVPKGWEPLVEDLCRRIVATLKTEGLDATAIKVLQVKEKFGGLRFYYAIKSEVPFKCTSSIRELVRDYSSASFNTCEECSSPGTLHSLNYWYMTVCEKCAPESYEPVALDD